MNREYRKWREQLDGFSREGRTITLERGWPCREQLDLSMPMLDMVTSRDNLIFENDYRGYAGTGGIAPAKRLFAGMLGCGPEDVYVGGTMSTTIMYDIVSKAVHTGLPGCAPWGSGSKFICPVPGYEKHFQICKAFGIQMVPVSLRSGGPDMDEVERLVGADPAIKGIWCVPLYSNPTGTIYSDETVRRLARMPAGPDFRIFWDHAYCVHHLTDTEYKVADILALCREAGVEDRAFVFASTSKITFPGGGMAACASSPGNIDWLTRSSLLQLKTGDKINQLRHCLFLKDMDGIRAHMRRHRQIIGPKFDLADAMLHEAFDGFPAVRWEKPKGGYFFDLELAPGTAKRTWEICREAGVHITPAGSTFPYGLDPQDSHIRLAPTYPDMEALKTAVGVLCLAAKLAWAEREGDL